MGRKLEVKNILVYVHFFLMKNVMLQLWKSVNNISTFVSKAFIETGQSIRGNQKQRLDIFNWISWTHGNCLLLSFLFYLVSWGSCDKKMLFHLSSVKLPDNYCSIWRGNSCYSRLNNETTSCYMEWNEAFFCIATSSSVAVTCSLEEKNVSQEVQASKTWFFGISP